MKTSSHLILSISLIITSSFSSTFVLADDSSTDPAIAAQVKTCNSSASSEWSYQLNRCVTKAQAESDRKAATACDDVKLHTTEEDRKACHMNLAESQTGLSSDTNKLSDNVNQGNTAASIVMNGVGTAYTILGLINKGGQHLNKSSCMSKKIFGVTAFVGTATDIYLKMTAKDKMKSLKDKYNAIVNKGSYDNQVMALQYLKDEQSTVADIADLEVKRNMALTIGYSAAAIMAAYEMISYGSTNPGCNKPEPKNKEGEKEITGTADTGNKNSNLFGKLAPAIGAGAAVKPLIDKKNK